MPPVVLKFGGTSVASLARWEVIAEQVRRCLAADEQPVLVCSAIAGISDRLVALAEAAPRGDHAPLLAEVETMHRSVADELGVDLDAVAGEELERLKRLVTGAALLEDVSPRVKARILARGELLSTRLGAAWLRSRGLDVRWVDARQLLESVGDEASEERRYLGAHVLPTSPEPLDLGQGAVITQGFIARHPKGHTVLLGRGGSDTSAALIASRLRAVRCEIWTDVPGLFTADPRHIGSARLLRRLAYAEAQEIATTGAKVLHPRCIAPLERSGVELVLRCTPAPSLPRTRIAATGSDEAQVKAISSRKGIVLVSMETVGMWQQVGFLSRAFAVFAAHGLSVDTVSTSETSVTVTLDPAANILEDEVLQEVLAELRPLCTPRAITGCASVSLVGRGIRTILHRLAPVLELFEEHRIHMVSQAASDLNLTVVVDDDQAHRLVEKLHALLFAHRDADEVFGPTWDQLFRPAARPGPARVGAQPAHRDPWWLTRRDELLALADRTPAYVYDEATLRARARSLASLETVDQVLYAMKANPEPRILRALADEGMGFETVSIGEVRRAAAEAPRAPLLFTPNFAHREEYAAARQVAGVTVTLDNLHPLTAWPEVFEGQPLFVRLDPGKGRGHHAKVRTAGARSKFGVTTDQLPQLLDAAERVGATIVGLHAHAGSGVMDPTSWQETALFLAEIASELPDVRALDLGGGLGIPARPGAPPLDLHRLDRCLQPVREAFPSYELHLEPGRFLVAEAGVLLCRVTQLKNKGSLRYVGVDAGMLTLLRPALYGARHHVVNLSRVDEPAGPPVTVVGPICESGDILARDRRLAPPREGDVLLIATAGAYGAAMSSDYNLRGRAEAVWLPHPL